MANGDSAACALRSCSECKHQTTHNSAKHKQQNRRSPCSLTHMATPLERAGGRLDWNWNRLDINNRIKSIKGYVACQEKPKRTFALGSPRIPVRAEQRASTWCPFPGSSPAGTVQG